MTVLQTLANAVHVLKNANPTVSSDITDMWHNRLEQLQHEYMPHGSGFDGDTKLQLERSTANQLCLTTRFHVMQCGIYCGWLYFDVIITPSLLYNFDTQVVITSDETDDSYDTDSDDWSNYVAQVFADALQQDITN